jgi:hypothetical protein
MTSGVPVSGAREDPRREPERLGDGVGRDHVLGRALSDDVASRSRIMREF